MRHDDLKNLRQVIRQVIRASGRRRRELEVVLGLGRGNLERLTDGTMELKVRHLLELAEFLAVPPADFLVLGCPETTAMAKRRLKDWLAPVRRAEEEGASAERPLSRADIAEVVRAELAGVMREELASLLQAMGMPAAPADGGAPQAS